MKFYVASNGHHEGPFDIQQLRYRNITRETLVWNETMAEWTPAGNVPYLIDNYFNIPAIPNQPSIPEQPEYAPGSNYSKPQPTPPCPSSWLVQSILVTLFCCLPGGIIGIVYASKVNGLYYSGKYDEAVNAANTAKKWCIYSAIASIVFYILYFILFVGIASSALL